MPQAMSTAPPTHHQIIELVDPFLRQGLHIDLAAIDSAGMPQAQAQVVSSGTHPGALLPTLTALSLLATVALLPHLGMDRIEGAWTLLYNVPTLLLAGAFMLQEMPRFEIPP